MASKRHLASIVLIETLWNVKDHLQELLQAPGAVLIETLWNVKYCKQSSGVRNVSGINRNIVECKDRCSAVSGSVPHGINRNIVECKVSCHIVIDVQKMY